MTSSEATRNGPRPPIGPRSWYEVLDVARDASTEEIEEAYERALALIEGSSIGGYMVLDPDAAEAAKSDVETAFLVLSDPELRAAFDAATEGEAHQTTPEAEVDALLDEDTAADQSAPPAPTSTVPRAASKGGIQFLAPVYDDNSGKIARPSPPSSTTTEGEPAPRRAPSEEPLEEWTVSEPMRRAPSTEEGEAERPASAKEPPKPQLRPGEEVSEPVVRKTTTSEVQTLPPDLEEALAEGSEVNGQVIRRLRESRGLSVEDVASATHIQRSYLVAIEENDHGELPGKVYLRGFLTQIARVLKVDKRLLSDGYMTFIDRFG